MNVTAHADGDRVVSASWLTKELLVLLLRVAAPEADSTGWRVLLEVGGMTIERGARWLPAAPVPDGPGTHAWVLTVDLPSDQTGSPIGRVALRHGDQSIELAPDRVDSLVCELPAFGTACRSEVDAAVRGRLAEFFATVPRGHQIELTPALAANLAALRDALRERLPGTKFEPGPCAARLETVTAIDEHGFWLTGWIHDGGPRETRFTAVSPEGTRTALGPGSVTFHPRPRYSLTLEDDHQVSTLGFHAYVELEDPSVHPDGWVMEFTTVGGRAVEHRLAMPVVTDTAAVWDGLLRQPGAEPPVETSLLNQMMPAISRLRGGGRAARVERVLDFGDVADAPELSIVVAVRELDRIQHQLISFSRDPDIAGAELIYLASADDPDGLAELAEGLHDLHGVPFRLAVLSGRASRARALNLGSSIARGSELVLMSGDVFPAAPGWLAEMTAVKHLSANAGAVGPKLLYEDDSIAHAGAAYVQRASGRWERTLPFAGFARHIGVASTARRVEAASDACLMVDRTLFADHGGFADLYLDGGDEAGDLCLRIGEHAEVWYAPGAELYLLDEPALIPMRSGPQDSFNEWLLRHRSPVLGGRRGDRRAFVPPNGRPTLGRAPGARPTRSGGPMEILEIARAQLDSSVILDGALIAPGPPSPDDPHENVYSLLIEGWAVPAGSKPLRIDIAHRGEIMWRAWASSRRQPVAASTAGAAWSQFRLVVNVLTLPADFELDIEVATADGARAPLGSIRARRHPLTSGYAPERSPVLITTIGRSGSRWLLSLLSEHPQIIALQDPGYEAVLTDHFVEMLLALAEPASYMMALSPQISSQRWWLGDRTQPLRPPEASDPRMAQWMARENLELLAASCQSRVDAFYSELARHQGDGAHRYYAEKTRPGPTARLVSELYPGGREIVLVRDFRDMVSSILAFNAKRGVTLWGYDAAMSEAQWLSHMRAEAAKVLDGWRERSDRVHLVRYEELLADPAATLTGIFTYLGLDADRDTIRTAIEQAVVKFPEAQAAHRTSSSFEASVGRWKRDLTPEQQAACAAAFDDLLTEFGYEATDVASAEIPSPDEAGARVSSSL